MLVEECIIDSFLCFISSAVHSYTKEQIVQLCLRFYSEDDVKKSKKIICELLKVDPKWRRSGDKKRLEMLDVVELVETVLKEEGIPKFVADSYYAFPTLSGFENIANDLMSLKVEISELKNNFEEEKKKKASPACSEDVMIVKEEIVEIKKYLIEVAKKSLPLSPKKNVARGNQPSSSSPIQPDQPIRSKSPLIPEISDPAKNKNIENTHNSINFSLQNDSVPVPKITQEQFSDVLKKYSKPDTSVVIGEQKLKCNKTSKPTANSTSNSCKTPAPGAHIYGGIKEIKQTHGKYTVDSEGFLTKNKHSSLKGINSTGSIKIQAVKKDVEIYIGRLVENTKLEDLIHHVENLLGIKVIRCRKLICKIRDCSSFKIIVSEEDADKFFSTNIWPEGSDVREFLPYSPFNRSYNQYINNKNA